MDSQQTLMDRPRGRLAVKAHLAWMLALLAGVCSFLVFDAAQRDFSYDYYGYLHYFDRLADLSWNDFCASVRSQLPLPFVEIPPQGQFEVGFAALCWFALNNGLSSATTYAIVCATSIAIRIGLWQASRVPIHIMVLTAIYSITLFEANAARVGCAITVTIGFVFALARGHRWLALGLAILAALFHLQSLAMSVPFFLLWITFTWISHSRGTRLLLAVGVFLLSIFSAFSLSFFTFAKLESYSDVATTAGGFTIVSMLAATSLLSGALLFVRGHANFANIANYKLWSCVLMSCYPALFALLIATQTGAVGDRLWQFAFVLLASVPPNFRKYDWFVKIYLLSFGLCLIVSVVNVTVRYPLSNFFAPLLPYAYPL